LKEQGNNNFKAKNYEKAITLYSEAIGKFTLLVQKINYSRWFVIEIEPHETIYSNRAACFIALKDFKHALEDCQAALRLNPSFSKCYKRMFKANIGLGNIQEAKDALSKAIEMDPTDATNKADT